MPCQHHSACRMRYRSIVATDAIATTQALQHTVNDDGQVARTRSPLLACKSRLGGTEKGQNSLVTHRATDFPLRNISPSAVRGISPVGTHCESEPISRGLARICAAKKLKGGHFR